MKLRDWRLTNDLTQMAMGVLVGLSGASISRIEAGAPPSPRKARAIFEATGHAVSPNDLYGLPDERAVNEDEMKTELAAVAGEIAGLKEQMQAIKGTLDRLCEQMAPAAAGCVDERGRDWPGEIGCAE